MKKFKDYSEPAQAGIILVAFFACVIIFLSTTAIFSAVQEAKVFNKFKSPSQPEATTWDALFAELRVTP